MTTHYDLVILGGGFTGTAAAMSAAREGLKVLIADKSGALGGAAVNCLVLPFMRYWNNKKNENGSITREPVNGGLFGEILGQLNALGGIDEDGQTFSEELLKLVLDRMLSQYHVDVLFHAYLKQPVIVGDTIKGLSFLTKSGDITIDADTFIDASGDADLAAQSGCPYHIGTVPEGNCQPMTLCFRVGNIDLDRFAGSGVNISALYQEKQRTGDIKNPREDVLKFKTLAPGVVHFNSTRVIGKCPVKAFDLSAAEREAREQVFELFSFLKENIPGYENSVLLMSAPEIGVRESRMIDGEYTITEQDLLTCRKFEDSIARGNYDIDIHNPTGSGTTLKHIPAGDYYTIPYRALVPKGISNLLVAGRCISSTHEAQSSYRIMPICACIGEAAGSAAAIAKKAGVAMREIPVPELQELLTAHGALI